MKKTLALCGGGTGGHIFPLVALSEVAADFGYDDVVMVGSEEGLESRLVSGTGLRLVTLPSGRVRGMGFLRQVRSVAGLGVAAARAIHLLRQNGVTAVIGSGGYASAAPLAAAASLRIPSLLLEQNAVPGTTNRVLSRFVSNVCTSFAHSAGWLPANKVVLTGNPVRHQFHDCFERRSTRRSHGHSVLVLGGSQGASFLNTTIAQLLARMVQTDSDLHVIHQCGEGREQEAVDSYRGAPRVRVIPFMNVDEMSQVLENTALIVGRAGATALAELAVAGVPSILIPFPFATDNHQELNARFYEMKGASRVFLQGSFDADVFAATVTGILSDPNRLESMGAAARAAALPRASIDIYRLLEGSNGTHR